MTSRELVARTGIGKTRLALRYAELHGGGGVCFCDLTTVT